MGSQQPTILIVDDNESHRYVVSRRLRDAGFMVKEAATGAEGIELAQTKPQFIVLDVKLPDINGFEVCRRLKADPTTSSIPILHLSAHQVASRDVARGLDLGADGYLVEPVEPEELLATIKSLLRLRTSEDQARLLAEQWQTTFNAIQDGICLVDSNGQVTQCNSAMAQLLGKSKVEILGRGYFSNLETLGALPLECRLDLSELQNHTELDFGIGNKWYRLVCDPIFDHTGLNRGAVAILQDTTKDKVAADSLAVKSRDLERSNSELEHFAYIASHDLKEPLRTISNYVTLLDRSYRPKLDETASLYLDFISNGSRRMHSLINDLLEFSKAGNAETVRDSVDCNQIFDQVIEDLKGSITVSQAQCTRSDLPRVAYDPHQMSQLFQNLISNGIKFRSQKPPRIHISAKLQGESYLFSIQDNGIGIPNEHREKVFVLFKRLHTRDQFPGNGIGLALCKKIVERAGGRIWFDSSVAEGTAFYFTVPRTAQTNGDLDQKWN